MKMLKTLSVFAMCLFFVSFQTTATGLRAGFSDYKIEEANDLVQESRVEKAWTLTYNDSDNAVKVFKRKNAENVYYVVNCDYFEVCYACTSKGFGAGIVKNAWSCVPAEINGAVINADELKKQKIILPAKVDDEKALGLIASYLPDLLNENYTHLLN